MSSDSVYNFGDPLQPWRVPPEDIARQATASLRGYIYQIHASAAAWLSLGPRDELYLEVAEDFTEILRNSDTLDDILSATQAKDTRESGAVTLNSPDVLAAIESLFRLRVNNPGRVVRLVFLTTSSAGKERKDALSSGTAGLVAWGEVAKGGDASELRAALLKRTFSEPLKIFVRDSSDEQFRDELVRSVIFACGAPDWRELEVSNRQALIDMRDELQSTADMAHRAYDAVFCDVIACALGRGLRRLNRDNLKSCLERATSIAVPSSIAVSFLSQPSKTKKSLSGDDLRVLAESLIEAGMPPSVDLLFPKAKSEAREALMRVFAVEPRLTEMVADGAPLSTTIAKLTEHTDKKHLIVGQPGSGKTLALWHAAKSLLASSTIVPLYLPAGLVASWGEMEAMITDTIPGIDLPGLFNDPRICVFVDSWSEFASASQASEKARALRAWRNTRVLATAKFADVGDGAFKLWGLDLPIPEHIKRAVATSTPGEALPSDAVLDLLRLPLLLAIHILSDARSTTTGDLLRQFHEYLMRDLPERFTDVLACAVAELSLAGTRSFGRLTQALQHRAAKAGLENPVRILKSLGTLQERAGLTLPVHDLYWSWLAGHGYLCDDVACLTINPLRTRESFSLAIQSGGAAREKDVSAMVTEDIVLSAMLDASRRVERPAPALVDSLRLGLADHRLAVRNRAALAALKGGRAEFFRQALEVLSSLSLAKCYPHEWDDAICPDKLYIQRATLADWLGSPDTEFVLNVIAERGGPEWNSWLKQAAADGRISWARAAAVALGCCANIPAWVSPHLDTVFASKAWWLRATAKRRSNKSLAEHIAREYGRLIDSVIKKNSSAWFELNRVLTGCGDDRVFQILLTNFASLSPEALEVLGYAIVEKGSPWIGRFQRVALAGIDTHHHQLADALSPDIDDETARQWIAAGHEKAGWRVLIARHGVEVLPEMLAELPPSFAGLHDIPSLACMRWLPEAPVTLIDELWRRLGSPMQPKAMQDILNAITRVFPQGMVHIVKFIAHQPDALPVFHLRQVLRLYEDWHKKTNFELYVKTEDCEGYPFREWILRHRMLNAEDFETIRELLPFAPDIAPDIAADFVLRHSEHEDRTISVLNAMNGLMPYHDTLLERMLASPVLAALIPQVFAERLDEFPVEALQRCMDSDYIDQNGLLFRLSSKTTPAHQVVHEWCITRLFNVPLRLEQFRYVASMLRGYSRVEVLNLIDAAPCQHQDSWFWFVRSVEAARGERLINEDGSLRRY